MTAFVAGLALGVARPVAAQATSTEGVYVSAGALIDFKRFSGNPATNVLDGEALGGSVTLGTSLTPRWDLEVGADIPRSTTDVHTRSVTIQRSTIALQSRTRNRPITMTALIRFRGTPHGRVQVGYLAGLSVLRLQRDFDTEAPANTPDSLIPSPHESVDYGAAPTAGIDARITITRHVSLVPAVCVLPFSSQDVSGVLVRPRVAIRWAF
jgi:hypothetical protein